MSNEDEIDHLSTTAYAVLGLLALGSWTAYELKQQAQRSLRFCWPKADSILYAQPGKLEALGLARSEVEKRSGRERNRYWITPDGRKVLRRWLATPSGPPQLEFEPILRLLFADQGTLDDARSSIDSMRRWAIDRTIDGLGILETYGTQDEPFPERRHLKLLTAVFYASLAEAILESAEFAAVELDRWETSGRTEPSSEMQTLVQDAARRLRSALERSPTHAAESTD